MLEAVEGMADDPRFRSDFHVLFDIRAALYTAEIEDGNLFVATLERRESDFQKRFALVVSDALQVLASLFCLVGMPRASTGFSASPISRRRGTGLNNHPRKRHRRKRRFGLM